jgi:hypothetical protein
MLSSGCWRPPKLMGIFPNALRSNGLVSLGERVTTPTR